MGSAVKIVKRDQIKKPKKQDPEIKPTPEQSTRETTVTVKRWVSEFRERKTSLIY